MGLRLIGRGRPRYIEFQGTDYEENDQVNYEFTDQPFGAVQPGRVVIVGTAEFASTANVSDVLIDGNKLTLVKRDGTSNSGVIAIWAGPVPTGTSGTIEVKGNGTLTGVEVVIWTLYGNAGDETPHSTDGFVSAARTSVDLNMPANGACVAMCASASSVTWSGVTYDSSNSGIYSAGSASNLAETAAYNISTSPTTAITIAASWG